MRYACFSVFGCLGRCFLTLGWNMFFGQQNTLPTRYNCALYTLFLRVLPLCITTSFTNPPSSAIPPDCVLHSHTSTRPSAVPLPVILHRSFASYRDYLTGFHKRKQARRRFGLAMQEIKDRKERLEERKEVSKRMGDRAIRRCHLSHSSAA